MAEANTKTSEFYTNACWPKQTQKPRMWICIEQKNEEAHLNASSAPDLTWPKYRQSLAEGNTESYKQIVRKTHNMP